MRRARPRPKSRARKVKKACNPGRVKLFAATLRVWPAVVLGNYLSLLARADAASEAFPRFSGTTLLQPCATVVHWIASVETRSWRQERGWIAARGAHENPCAGYDRHAAHPTGCRRLNAWPDGLLPRIRARRKCRRWSPS